MPEEIVMPRLSDTMEEGTIARWLKGEGDPVKRGEPLLEVETDKATMELQAYSDGVLQKILVPDGGTAPLGAPIGILALAGEEAGEGGDGQAAPAERSAPAPREAKRRGAEARAAPADTAAAPDDARAERLPREREQASGAALTPSPSLPRGERSKAKANGQHTPLSTQHAALGTPPSPEPPLRATPVARRLAEEHHLDLAALAGRGSGPGGRIVQLDVERYLESHPPAARPLTPSPPPTRGEEGTGRPSPTGREGGQATREVARERPPAPPEAPPGPEADVERRPVSRIHRLMAEHTLQSVREIPHYYLTVEIDVGAALDLRRQLADALGEEGKVSVNDLVLKATALALRAVPEVNVRWEDGALLVYRRVHLGMAVAVPDGLVVPVIRDADQKALSRIGAEARDLAARARAGQLTAAELEGGTFTVTNLGMFGVEEFQGIINAPEAGLLAVGAVAEKPAAWQGGLALRPRLRATLAADHRAYSGDVGARFLQALTRLLQEPLRLGF